MAGRQLLEHARIADVVTAVGAARLGELLDLLDDRLAAVVAGIAASDLALPPQAERDLHQLRGSAASLGLVELAAEIAGIERRVRAIAGDANRLAAIRAVKREAAGLALMLAESRAALAPLVPDPVHGAGSNR